MQHRIVSKMRLRQNKECIGMYEGYINKWIDSCMYGLINGWTDKWMNRKMNHLILNSLLDLVSTWKDCWLSRKIGLCTLDFESKYGDDDSFDTPPMIVETSLIVSWSTMKRNIIKKYWLLSIFLLIHHNLHLIDRIYKGWERYNEIHQNNNIMESCNKSLFSPSKKRGRKFSISPVKWSRLCP